MRDRPDAPPRAYRSARRDAQARRTRRRVLDAATTHFLDRGYAAATMPAIAGAAGVAVSTVELLFGTKARLLKAAIDVAIAGDDESVAMLDREWAADAAAAVDPRELLRIAAGVIGPAQSRSAGLVLAVFEGAASDPALAELSAQMIVQRAATATWLVDRLVALDALRAGSTRDDAIDTLWVLMDPAVFDRLTRHRGWTVARYQRWLAGALVRLLVDHAWRATAGDAVASGPLGPAPAAPAPAASDPAAPGTPAALGPAPPRPRSTP